MIDLTNRNYIVYLFVVSFFLVFFLASCSSVFYSKRLKKIVNEMPPPAWVGQYSKIDLSKYLTIPYAKLDFSAKDERFILLRTVSSISNLLIRESELKGIDKSFVINIDGSVDSAVGKDGTFKDMYIDLFFNISNPTKFEVFSKDAKKWAFSDNYRYGIKFTKSYEDDETLKQYCIVELWDLVKSKIIWKKSLQGISLKEANFIEYNNKQAILLAFSYEAYIVLMEDGLVLKKIEYNNERYTKISYNPMFEDKFYGTNISYNDNRRWFACGDSSSRRVRIYSIDSSVELIIELNSKDHPYRPMGGGWRVNDVEFSSRGKYLVINYEYSGRYTSKYCDSTEIYDTANWQMCWYENMNDIKVVKISPSEERIAFIRGTVLEVGDFSCVVNSSENGVIKNIGVAH